MRIRGFLVALSFFLAFSIVSEAQTISQYTVKRTQGKMTINGKLSEPCWKTAPFTAPFVIYNTGAAPKLATRARMLWDDRYLYIAFSMDDTDVWAKTKVWKRGVPCLCQEEVAEVFIDPDGDGLNYLEAEINPFGALMALRLDQETSDGDYSWSYKKLQIGIDVTGTLNNPQDVDKGWTCELAFPFEEIAFTSPSKKFPPRPGDSWRINLYRYEYPRPSAPGKEELSAWNRTKWTASDKDRGFHAPNYFGKIIFSDEKAGGK